MEINELHRMLKLVSLQLETQAEAVLHVASAAASKTDELTD
jgi:hypothetical protein